MLTEPVTTGGSVAPRLRTTTKHGGPSTTAPDDLLAYIARLVATAPPLSSSQRARLGALLQGDGRAAEAGPR